MRRTYWCLVAWLEDQHARKVVMTNARQRARDRALLAALRDIGHGAVTTKKPTNLDGGAVTLTPAPHPCISEGMEE